MKTSRFGSGYLAAGDCTFRAVTVKRLDIRRSARSASVDAGAPLPQRRISAHSASSVFRLDGRESGAGKSVFPSLEGGRKWNGRIGSGRGERNRRFSGRVERSFVGAVEKAHRKSAPDFTPLLRVWLPEGKARQRGKGEARGRVGGGTCHRKSSSHRIGLRTNHSPLRRSSPRETDPQGGSEIQKRAHNSKLLSGGFSTGLPQSGSISRRGRNGTAPLVNHSRHGRDRCPEFLKISINIDKFTGFIGKLPTIYFLWNGRRSSGAGGYCHGSRPPR